MHYNMIHSRPINSEEHIVFEENEWHRTDHQALGDMISMYESHMEFQVTFTVALDDTPMIVMYHPVWGYRVIIIRS